MESKYLTGIRNTDYLIYNKLNDMGLYNLCLLSKAKSGICNDDEYFKYRIRIYYGDEILSYKPNSITYKQQYIDIIKVLYKDGIKGYDNPYYGRIDLLLAANLIYGWKPDDINMGNIAGQGDVEIFLLACDIFDYEPNEVLSEYINRMFHFDVNQTEMVMYAIDKYGIYPNQITIDAMCKKKYLPLLKYLSGRGYNPSIYGLDYAVRGGNVEIINWLHQDLGLMPSDETLQSAIVGQHTDIFVWLIEGFELKPTENLINVATSDGNLDLVKMLININGTLPDNDSLIDALANNELDILKYLWTTYNIRPIKTGTPYETNNFESLKWYVDTFNERISQETINGAIIVGYFDILIWGYDEFNLLPDDEESINMGAVNGFTEIIKWLYSLNISMDFSENIDEIALQGHLSLCKFIYEKYGIHPGQEVADIAMEYALFNIVGWLETEFGIKPTISNGNVDEEE